MEKKDDGILDSLRSISSHIDPRERIRRTAYAVTRAVGSPTSLLIHTILFGVCFYAAYDGLIAWESMLLILTTLVSLEAIYLSLFIQMTLNFTTEDIEEVSEDIEEMQEDIGELQEDVEDISEDVEEIAGEEESEEVAEEARKAEQKRTLATIQNDLRKLMADIDRLQKNQPPPGAVPLL